MQIYLQATKKY